MIVDELQAEACVNGFGCVDDAKLFRAILLQLLYDWSGGSGGGGPASNNKSGVDSPVGVVTPDYVGQFYTALGPPVSVWTATGLTNADWIEVAGNLS